MKELNVHIGDDALSLYLEIAVDGEVVVSKKADSYLINYMKILRSFLTGEAHGTNSNQIRANRSSGTAVFDDAFQKADGVAIVAGKLQITDSSGHGMTTGDIAYVMGVNGISGGNPNGWHAITSVSGTIFELTNLTGLSGTHSEATSVAWYYKGKQAGSTLRSLDETLAEAQIRVGTGTAANTTSTEGLDHEIPSKVSIGSGARSLNLSAASATVNTPSVGATDSTIDIVQGFTNSSGATITIEEMGIWVRYYDVATNDHRHVLIVRDVLGASSVSLLDTQTLTVTYKMTTDVPTTSGGFLIQFNELGYRQYGQTTRESKDIFNANQTKGDNEGQLYANSHGGDNPLLSAELSSTSYESYRIGPRVGISTTNVVNTDFRLQDGAAADTAIKHGTSTGQFYHYGAEISAIKLSGTQMSIELTRVYENLSSGTITVNECGVYVAYIGSITTNPAIENIHCIARHLVTPVSVLNTEFLKITYTIALNV